ncbi:MAG: nucleotidyl transferase AbiEii/AbiGii toxin family protein [Vicinamibacteria bacterium]
MIGEAEIRRRAGQWGVDPGLLDLDYALGWLLAELYRIEKVRRSWIFKGGTCLRKCYFPDYRFSEDLDFSVPSDADEEATGKLVLRAAAGVRDRSGLDLQASPLRTEQIRLPARTESWLEIRIYFRGVLPQARGASRLIRVQLDPNERVLLPTLERPLLHPYADKPRGTRIRCYDLAEILAEKLRAVCGQRVYPVSRDVYDIARLTREDPSCERRALSILSEKARAKGIDMRGALSRLTQRRSPYRLDWERNLVYLIPQTDRPSFPEAWDSVLGLVSRIRSPRSRKTRPRPASRR